MYAEVRAADTVLGTRGASARRRRSDRPMLRPEARPAGLVGSEQEYEDFLADLCASGRFDVA